MRLHKRAQGLAQVQETQGLHTYVKQLKKVYSMRRSRQIIYHDNCCLSTCHLIYGGVERNGISSLDLLRLSPA
jgi:hypothetical protein